MKIKWNQRLNRHENDCWNSALALALDKDYELVRKELKPFINENGTLESLIGIGVLVKEGYKLYAIDKTLTVGNFIRMYNTFNNHCVLSILVGEKELGHLVYIKNNTIYDIADVEVRGQYYNWKVNEFLMKEAD